MADEKVVLQIDETTSRDVAGGMTCEEAFAEAGTRDAQCARVAVALKRHPFLSRFIVQPTLLHAYEKANGPVVGAIDWKVIVQWIITNGPTIMQLIMTLLGLFGL